MQTRTFGRLFGDIALTGRWLHREMVSPSGRAMLLDAAWRSIVLMAVAFNVLGDALRTALDPTLVDRRA